MRYEMSDVTIYDQSKPGDDVFRDRVMKVSSAYKVYNRALWMKRLTYGFGTLAIYFLMLLFIMEDILRQGSPLLKTLVLVILPLGFSFIGVIIGTRDLKNNKFAFLDEVSEGTLMLTANMISSEAFVKDLKKYHMWLTKIEDTAIYYDVEIDGQIDERRLDVRETRVVWGADKTCVRLTPERIEFRLVGKEE